MRTATRPTRQERQKAFTLVELLVVISIVALLLTILMPTLLGVQEQARRAVCAYNIDAMIKGSHLYAGDNNDHYPHADGMYMFYATKLKSNAQHDFDDNEDNGGTWAEWRGTGSIQLGDPRDTGNGGRQEQWFLCLGLLHAVGYEGDIRKNNYVSPKGFFCPSEKERFNPWWDKFYVLRYIESEVDGEWCNEIGSYSPLSGSYQYHANTMVEAGDWSRGEIPDDIPVISPCPTVDEMTGLAMIADDFANRQNHGTGFNVGLADGGVYWCSDPDQTVLYAGDWDCDAFDYSWAIMAQR